MKAAMAIGEAGPGERLLADPFVEIGDATAQIVAAAGTGHRRLPLALDPGQALAGFFQFGFGSVAVVLLVTGERLVVDDDQLFRGARGRTDRGEPVETAVERQMAGGIRHCSARGQVRERGGAQVVPLQSDPPPGVVDPDHAGAVSGPVALEHAEQPCDPCGPLIPAGKMHHREPGVKRHPDRQPVHGVCQLLEAHEGRAPPSVPVEEKSEDRPSGWRDQHGKPDRRLVTSAP